MIKVYLRRSNRCNAHRCLFCIGSSIKVYLSIVGSLTSLGQGDFYRLYI